MILVIDDDNRIRKLLGKFLREHGLMVMGAKNALEARELLEEFKFDLIILDVMMPGESGIEFSSSIRMDKKYDNLPILMLSAMVEADHRILGLENGADDYMIKPFEPRELLLKVNKIIKRSRIDYHKDQAKFINIGKMVFDATTNRLTNDGEIINLTFGEAKLMSILSQNIGVTMTREELAVLCGGINERSIDVQIIRLRNKIESDPRKPRYLHAMRGKGYVLYGD